MRGCVIVAVLELLSNVLYFNGLLIWRFFLHICPLMLVNDEFQNQNVS